MDPDGWRDESTEGPYDYLASWMKHPEYQVFRPYNVKPYYVLLNSDRIHKAATIDEAKKFAKKHHREMKRAANVANRQDQKHDRAGGLGSSKG
jgi:hypothetical protein